MLQSRISFNVNGYGLGDPNYARSVLKGINPTTLVIMNDINLALEMKRDLPECIVVYRQFTPVDGDYWRKEGGNYIDPVTYVTNLPNYPQLVHYVLNEPHANVQQIPQLLKWLVDVMKEAAKQNKKLCVGNFYAGFAEPDQIFDKGLFDEFLKTAGELKDWVWIGFHEGSAFLLPWGVSSFTTQDMYDKNKVQPQSWKRNIPLGRQADGSLPPHWMIRRPDWMIIRAMERGYTTFRALITEYTWDWNNIPGIPEFLRWLRDNHGGANGRQNFYGVGTYPAPARSYFPQWDFEDWIFEQLKWTNDIYPSYVEGVTLFTWNWDQDWVQGGYNFGGFQKLHTRMRNETLAIPIVKPKPPKEPEVEKYVRVNVLVLNLRDTPYTNKGRFVRALRRDEILTPLDMDIDCAIDMIERAKEFRENEIWIHVMTQQGYEGWVAAWLLDYK